MRLVSSGASAESEGGTVLGVRLGGGDSGGFGCVSVNGSSTDKSLESHERVRFFCGKKYERLKAYRDVKRIYRNVY